MKLNRSSSRSESRVSILSGELLMKVSLNFPGKVILKKKRSH